MDLWGKHKLTVESNWEAATIVYCVVWIRADKEEGNKWMDLAGVLEIELMGFSDPLNIQGKGQENLKDESLVFALSTSMHVGVIY